MDVNVSDQSPTGMGATIHPIGASDMHVTYTVTGNNPEVTLQPIWNVVLVKKRGEDFVLQGLEKDLGSVPVMTVRDMIVLNQHKVQHRKEADQQPLVSPCKNRMQHTSKNKDTRCPLF